MSSTVVNFYSIVIRLERARNIPSSTSRSRSDFKSAKLHIAAAQMCFTFAAVEDMKCSDEEL